MHLKAKIWDKILFRIPRFMLWSCLSCRESLFLNYIGITFLLLAAPYTEIILYIYSEIVILFKTLEGNV
jgi:hypothetical protein